MRKVQEEEGRENRMRKPDDQQQQQQQEEGKGIRRRRGQAPSGWVADLDGVEAEVERHSGCEQGDEGALLQLVVEDRGVALAFAAHAQAAGGGGGGAEESCW